MFADQHDLRLAFSLTIARDDVERDPSTAEAVTATVTFAYCANGVRCDGELNLRISHDE